MFASKKGARRVQGGEERVPGAGGHLILHANAALHSGFVAGPRAPTRRRPPQPVRVLRGGDTAEHRVHVQVAVGAAGDMGADRRGVRGAGAVAGLLVWGLPISRASPARVSTEAAYAQLSEGESDSDYDTDDAGSIPGLFDSDAEHERFQVSDVEAGSPMTKPQFMRRVSSRTRLGGQYARHGSARSLGGMVSHPSSDSLASSFSRSLTNAAVVGGGFQRRTKARTGRGCRWRRCRLRSDRRRGKGEARVDGWGARRRITAERGGGEATRAARRATRRVTVIRR